VPAFINCLNLHCFAQMCMWNGFAGLACYLVRVIISCTDFKKVSVKKTEMSQAEDRPSPCPIYIENFGKN
jgi:hypothetical protein